MKEHRGRWRIDPFRELSPDGICIIGTDGRLQEVNAAYCRLIGYSEHELLGMSLATLEAGTSAAQVHRHIAAIIAHGQDRFETQQRRKDGSLVDLEVTVKYVEVDGHGRLFALFRDVTDRRRAEHARREQQAFLQISQAIAHIGSWEWNLASGAVKWSDEMYRIYGTDRDAFGESLDDAFRPVHPDDRARIARLVDDIRDTGEARETEYRIVRPGGEVRHLWVKGQLVRGPGGEASRVIGTVMDVSERKAAEDEMSKLSSALQQAADSIMITDRHGKIEYVNPAFEQTTGYTREEAIGREPRLVKSGRHDAAFYQELWRSVLSGNAYRNVFINRKKDGTLYYEEKTISPLKDGSGRITHFISTGKDITERMQTQERLQHLAYHDMLTELPNRTLLMDRLEHALARVRWSRRQLAVLFLDLDRFKVINDTLGHNVGDCLLQVLAERLQACVRKGDTVARLSGDEFAILLEDLASTDDVVLVARKVLEAFAEAFNVDGRELFVTTSVGISVHPADGDDAQTLLKNADTAMYRAKDRGRNNYQFYSADMSARAVERLTLETGLRRALERGEFRLHYQPQVDLASGRIIGAEALIRWQHQELGLLAPGEFIGLLEETGLIVSVGEWVMSTACGAARRWAPCMTGDFRITVNLSARQFNEPRLVDHVAYVLADSGLDPRCLELEITESVIMQNAQSTIDTLRDLSAMGVRLAIDDFGTGYSSLSYLRRFPIHTLKVDRAFVHELPDNADDVAIVRAIIAMAHNLKLEVIAEGVENQRQLDFLRENGCDGVQGFLLGRPVPAEAFGQLLAGGGAGE